VILRTEVCFAGCFSIGFSQIQTKISISYESFKQAIEDRADGKEPIYFESTRRIMTPL
jgi:hypothetical protein